MKGVSPLGRYATAIAAATFLLVILAAIYGHTFGTPDQLIDAMALVVFGIISGTAGSLTMLNGTVRRTQEQDEEIVTLRRQVSALAKIDIDKL